MQRQCSGALLPRTTPSRTTLNLRTWSLSAYLLCRAPRHKTPEKSGVFCFWGTPSAPCECPLCEAPHRSHSISLQGSERVELRAAAARSPSLTMVEASTA